MAESTNARSPAEIIFSFACNFSLAVCARSGGADKSRLLEKTKEWRRTMKNNTRKQATEPAREFLQVEPMEISEVELLSVAGGGKSYTHQTDGACLTPTLEPSNFIC
jgi:hypothetical protein